MKSNYKYIIFVPYFGKLPQMFDLWVQSCSYNPEFLFIVFTDDNYAGHLPKNVNIKNMSFETLQTLVQSKFDFPISLKTPYKLCDYKPAFGYIFQEYLQDCVYWGHCDIDLLFGDIFSFLPSQEYNKISYLGHFCLYRNTPKINTSFMLDSGHSVTYKEIFSSDVHFAFDEDECYGINKILHKHNFSIYAFDKYVADVSCLHINFSLSHYKDSSFYIENGERIFSVEKGHVYACSLVGDNVEQKEYAYVHMQKRHMNRLFDDTPECFLITPTAFETWQPVTQTFIKAKQICVSWWKALQKIMTIKRNSTPRALRRKFAVMKIKYFDGFKRKYL